MTDAGPHAEVAAWLTRLNAAGSDPAALSALFGAHFGGEAHWRDLACLRPRFATVSGPAAVGAALGPALAAHDARNFRLAPRRHGPVRVERAGVEVAEAVLEFDCDAGRGEAVVRLVPASDGRGGSAAWILLTSLLEWSGARAPISAAPVSPAGGGHRDFSAPNWADRRAAAEAYADRDPEVLIVGGGHAGIVAAACLNRQGVDALVVDRMARVGDNWRLRYHALALHNQKFSNIMPFLDFPTTFPSYIPKDLIADWLEFYVRMLEVNFWTETEFGGAVRDAASGVWEATVTRAGQAPRVLRPRHIVMATSVSGTPNLPRIPGIEAFGGEVVHSSAFASAEPWRGRDVIVMGTGTSGHDISQDLHAKGARVTLAQRSPTLVTQVEPSAQLFDGIFFGDGPSMDDRDLLALALPLEPMKRAHRILAAKSVELDRPLLDGLEAVGFRLDYGEDGTGWPLKYRTRGGGYYFNIGASDLVAAGEIGLIQVAQIAGWEAGGARMEDGRLAAADLVVLATGYKGLEHMLPGLFGAEVAGRVGQVWGFDADQELAGMWTRTGQEGLWFTGGAYSQVRMFSRILARQIAQELDG
ncbi:MAG: NAD(P)/FAD-dependent oxidoreductase [Pseudomonadota bacterium]|nr:NAD(P)/FAD-dependent oxidoreductase [Pseudomonadota bacterium]